MTHLQILLTINQQSKSIPYPPATNVGSQNFGFRVLKGKIDKIKNIHEAKDSIHIKEILRVLNKQESPFFSVGCEKSFNSSPNGYWAKGYIEFAFNYRNFIADAQYYFPLFFHFSRYASDFVARHDVQFWWDIQPARFEAVNSDGFSCCVWISTKDFSSPIESRGEWESAVALFSSFIETLKIQKPDTEPIY